MNQVVEPLEIEGGQGPGHLFYPPRGLLVWALVVTFIIAFTGLSFAIHAY